MRRLLFRHNGANWPEVAGMLIAPFFSLSVFIGLYTGLPAWRKRYLEE